MEDKKNVLENTCDFRSVKPIMMELPYPPIQVNGKNRTYANLLSVDYCGSVSEMSAITQYINNENCLSGKHCLMANTILGIAMAEMVHLQKLGELILLLGEKIDFTVKLQDGRQKMWTPEYLTISESPKGILVAGIESEKAAINQYKMHMRMIKDNSVNAVLARIIKDEEYHIMLLQALMKN